MPGLLKVAIARPRLREVLRLGPAPRPPLLLRHLPACCALCLLSLALPTPVALRRVTRAVMSAGGERSLDVLLRTMDPMRAPGVFRFVTYASATAPPRQLLEDSYATVREDGVLSLILRVDELGAARRAELERDEAIEWSETDLGWITLTVRVSCKPLGSCAPCLELCALSRGCLSQTALSRVRRR